MDEVNQMNIEKSDEIQAPLGDGEISRLIQAASKASYQPVAGYSRPKDVSFQKHNLIEMARAAKPLIVDKPISLQQNSGPADLVDAEIVETTAKSEIGTEHEVSGEEALETPEPIIDAELLAKEIKAAEERATKAAEDQSALAIEVAEKSAYDKGYQAGIDSVSSNVEQEMAKALVVMEAAGQAFTATPISVARDLRHAMEQTLLAMASVRAGSQIDTMPASFLKRIELMADRVQVIATRPILRLHPADLDAISALVSGSEALSNVRLIANPDLARGDVDLSLGGVRLADILGPIPPASDRSYDDASSNQQSFIPEKPLDSEPVSEAEEKKLDVATTGDELENFSFDDTKENE